VNWRQLKTVLWLRARLTRNQWAKSGGLGAVLAAVGAVLVLVLSAIAFVGGLAVGLFALKEAEPRVVLTVTLVATGGFLFIWIIGLITELQRSETIDLQRLMHLPVQLGQIFVVNYAASHMAVSVLLFVPGAFGLAVGLAISRGPRMLLLIPLAFGMVFMVTAWTYYLRGWLATLMTNPRRRRAIVMGLSMGFILLVQAPNIYFNVIRDDRSPAGETREQRRARDARETEELFALMTRYQVVVPPLWLPAGAGALVEGRVMPALFGMCGLLAIGALGLRRSYRSTLRFYHGETGGKASTVTGGPPKARTAGPIRDGTAFLERTLPGVPDQAAAVAFATFQSMLRAPEIKMQWGTSFLITLFIGASLLFRSSGNLPAWAGPFLPTGVVVFSMFLTIGFVGNQFGFDRDGFRAMLLAPIDRWQVLFGKNLAALPPTAAASSVLVMGLGVWLHLPVLVVLASLLQLATGLCLTMMAGNALSIAVPYRIQPGSMKPTKMPAGALILLLVLQMSLPLALTPAFLPPLAGFLSARSGGPDSSIVNLTLSLVMAAGMALLYWWSLGPAGRWLRRREMRILEIVSADVE
jgi:hypothetical protein